MTLSISLSIYLLKWSHKLTWVNFWPKGFRRNYRFTLS